MGRWVKIYIAGLFGGVVEYTVPVERLSGGPGAVADHENEDRWVRAIEF